MRRREFIAGLGSAAALPVAARAQQPADRVRRIGVLMGTAENDPQGKAFVSGFMQGLGKLGWSDGRNLRIDIRWAPGSVERTRIFAKELVDLKPDVILVGSTSQTAALQRETHSIPIVFATVSDPVGEGFVAGLPRPGGNITGLPCRRVRGTGCAETKLVQIFRGRQNPMRWHGKSRRPSELCRAGVLSRDHAGRTQHPKWRSARERRLAAHPTCARNADADADASVGQTGPIAFSASFVRTPRRLTS
jgi:hypothetical protein